MFPFTVGPPCERVLFDHSPFYGGSLLRAVASSAATAMLSRFVSIRSDYLDAIRTWGLLSHCRQCGQDWTYRRKAYEQAYDDGNNGGQVQVTRNVKPPTG